MPERVKPAKPSVSDEHAIPDEYGWPGGEAIAATDESLFWISPDPKRSATPLFMVCASEDHALRVITGGCYLKWAIKIVDGLRLLEESS